MVELWLPYGKTEVPVRVPDENLLGLIDVNDIQPVKPVEEILRAINNPIGSSKLEEIAKPGNKVAIVIDDPYIQNNLILSPLLDKLNSLGIGESEITVILGCNTQNFGRSNSKSSAMLEEVANRVKIATSSVDADDFTYLGNTSRCTKVRVNKLFMEADLRILTGRIGFHPYAGYTGGRDGVLPAICGNETIHCSYTSILDSKAKPGSLEGNPFNEEMEEAARLAKVNFIVNVILNSKGEVVNAFAGDLNRAFLEGVHFMDEKFGVSTDKAADIVIFSSGGYPWDMNLYQACGGLASAFNIVKDDGVIIWVAECPMGYGSDVFYDWMSKLKTVDEAATEIRRRYRIGGDIAYLLLKTLNRAKIILVSIFPDYYSTGVFRLRTARTVNAALNSAFRILDKKGKILVLPHGNTVYPTIKKE